MKYGEKPAVLATTKKETRRRLLVLADYLETVPEHRLNQRAVVDEQTILAKVLAPAHVDCGTSACAAGFATTIKEFQLAGLSLGPDGGLRLRGYNERFYSMVLPKFFGIKQAENELLFGMTPSTPKLKAAQIRIIASHYK